MMSGMCLQSHDFSLVPYIACSGRLFKWAQDAETDILFSLRRFFLALSPN